MQIICRKALLLKLVVYKKSVRLLKEEENVLDFK